MSAIITFVYPIIREDFIYKSLYTLYKFTDHSKIKVIIVDQTVDGLMPSAIPPQVNMVIRQKNIGFAAAANTGLIHGLRWETPYLAVVNDDTVFIYEGWLEDALEEFKTDPKILAVNPECPKIAMWGYGMTEGEYVEIMPYKDAFTAQDIAYLKSGDYDKEEISARHPFKIPESFPFEKRGVVDGFAGWLPIFKREALIEVGMYDERFVWGGGEDYDLMARAYSCAWPIERDKCEPKLHRRMVSTMKSWVWHHWGQSKDFKSTLDPELFTAREAWNDLDALWPPDQNGGAHMDPWGHHDGIPLKRVPEMGVYKS